MEFGALGLFRPSEFKCFWTRKVLDLGLRPMIGFGLENWATFGHWVFNGILGFWIFGFGPSYEEVKKVFTLVWTLSVGRIRLLMDD